MSSALASLPESVQKQGLQTTKKSTSILEIVALTSPDGRYDSLFLSNYATINLLERSPASTASAASPCSAPANTPSASGSIRRSCRRAGSPAGRHRRRQPAEPLDKRRTGRPAAGAAGSDFQYSLNVHGKLDDVSEFEKIIVKTDKGGRITRLQDVAASNWARSSTARPSSSDGRPSAGMAIYQLPNANALEVAKRVEDAHEGAGEGVPRGDGLDHSVRHDEVRRARPCTTSTRR